MGHDRKLRRLLPVGAAALAVGGAALFAAPSSASSTSAAAKDDAKRCVTLNLIDRLVKWFPSEAVPSPVDVPVGFQTIWFSQVHSSDDPSLVALGANGVLDIIDVNTASGAVTGYFTELFQFPAGGFKYSGSYNRTAAVHLQWITSQVTGFSGAYVGMSGEVHWRITSLTDPAIPVEEHVFMCAHDED